MDYKSFLLKSPLFWILLGGFLFGAAVAHLTVAPRRTKNPARTRRRKPTKIFLLLSGAIPSFTTAVILSLPEVPRDAKHLLVAACAALAGGLGLRFKKTAGILLLLLAGLAGFGARAALRGWTPVYAPADAGSIEILHRGEGETTLLTSFGGIGENVVTFPSGKISVLLDLLILDDAYVLAGRKTSYRLAALRVGETEQPLGPPRSGGDFAEKLPGLLPGVRLLRVEAELPREDIFSIYRVRIDPGAETAALVR